MEAIFKSTSLDIKQGWIKCTDKEAREGHRRP